MNLREAWISASSFVESYQYMIVKVHFVVLKISSDISKLSLLQHCKLGIDSLLFSTVST